MKNHLNLDEKIHLLNFQALPKGPIITKTSEATAVEGYLSEEDEEPFSFTFSFQLKHSNSIYKPK